ncbi:MAG TPA: hypothetical protein VFA20_24650 [Myxococcaceae bacterium]|nr:hypothetical protein [Myxococcaceae bacterium]
MKKAVIVLCSFFALAAFAAPMPDGPPVGGGSGGTGGGGSYPSNGVRLNGQDKAGTGFKAPNAKVRGGKLFIHVAK